MMILGTHSVVLVVSVVASTMLFSEPIREPAFGGGRKIPTCGHRICCVVLVSAKDASSAS